MACCVINFTFGIEFTLVNKSRFPTRDLRRFLSDRPGEKNNRNGSRGGIKRNHVSKISKLRLFNNSSKVSCPHYTLLLCTMPPSVTRLRWQALSTAIKATILHYTSKKYPRDWSLTVHIQFAILRKLDASMLNWTVEEVLSSGISLMGLDTKLFNELPF